ncbi:MAG: esterase/lipase family protein [Gammaproteobacteria bacterium]
MMRLLTLLCSSLLVACASPKVSFEGSREAAADTVVLLHGLGRGSGSMRALATLLGNDGYRVCSIDYASTRHGPPELVRQVTAAINDCAPEQGSMHVVTHSLGGILLRAWARENPGQLTGRAVMLAPPNRGSELSDVVGHSGLLRAVLGPTGADLGTNPFSFPNRLGPARFPVGVIAGTRSLHPLGYFLLEGPNDGTVTARSARLAGMRDFVTVHRAHSFIMGAPEVMYEVSVFLRDGCFSRELEDVSYDASSLCADARSEPADAALAWSDRATH